MTRHPIAAAVLAAAAALAAPAHAAVNVYDSASFVEIGAGQVGLDGFGRGSSARIGPSPSLAPGREAFFDTWNIDTSQIGAGTYAFDDFLVDAFGSVIFNSVTLNSYDALGVRNTVLFDLNALGTQAVGSGQFTVLAQCPVQSCVWLDIVGTQAIGSSGGYGGDVIAAVVPEPASAALFALGLAGLAAAARRRQA